MLITVIQKANKVQARDMKIARKRTAVERYAEVLGYRVKVDFEPRVR